MRKFPETSSYNVFISEPHRELHMKGSWLRDQKSVSCWVGSISCSCRIFTASVCCRPPPPPLLHFPNFFFFFWFLAQSFWGIFKNSQDPVCLLTSNYSYAELFRNEMSSNKQCMPTDLYAIWLFCQLMAFCKAAALQAVHIRCVGLCYPCFLHLLQNDLL